VQGRAVEEKRWKENESCVTEETIVFQLLLMFHITFLVFQVSEIGISIETELKDDFRAVRRVKRAASTAVGAQ
jgi:hypothetical protein